MTCAVVRMGVGAGLMALTTVVHAATPLTLPFGELGLQATTEIELPLPPPPQQVARPDVTQMRLVIKRQPPRGCTSEETRRNVEERRQTATFEAAAAGARRLRLG